MIRRLSVLILAALLPASAALAGGGRREAVGELQQRLPPTASRLPQFQLSAGVKLSADTVRIGDPFTITVAVRAPKGASMVFPDAPDSTSTVQALDPKRVQHTRDTTADEEFAVYRVAAWDIGAQPIKLADVVVTYGGVERRVPLAGYAVFVRSVLPADSTLRVPKPPRPLFEFGIPLWWWLLAALVAALIIGLLVWWWRRHRQRRAIPIPVDPFERAEREFQRIDSLGLLDAGERGRYVALVIEVLRDYLAARYEGAPLSLTSTELLVALRGEPAVPIDRLSRLLDEADLVKFARRPLSIERARELGREARGVVVSEHHASRPVAAEQAA